MAINLDAIRAKLGDLQKNTGKGERQDTLWKPEPGTQVVRIVPYQFNKDNQNLYTTITICMDVPQVEEQNTNLQLWLKKAQK